MKKSYLVSLITLTGFSALAQPVLTESNASPVIGDSYIYSRINWDGIPPSSGANQTWNYAGIVEIATASMDFVNPASCPSAGSFPAATVACDVDGGTQYEFTQITSTANNRVGFYAGGYTIPYSDSEKILAYPFTYNDTYVDAFASTFTTSVTMTRAGDVTVTAIGYGTLTLPNSTISNVLLVKVTEDYGDSYMGTELYHYNTDIYMFYKPGVSYPVFALTNYVQGSTVVNYGNFMDDPALGTGTNTLEEISVYPIPATDYLSINLKTEQNIQAVEIYDVIGERVFYSNQAVNSVDLNDFETGVYFLHVWDGENKVVRKFVKN